MSSPFSWSLLALSPLLACAVAFADPKAKPVALDLGDKVTLNLVWIKPGTIAKGSDTTLKTTRIGKGFHIGQTEVTQAQWKAVMGTTPWMDKPLTKEGDDFPATYVDWGDASDFCRKASKITGKSVRLPTELEWEYACRAGSSSRYCFGDGVSGLDTFAWHKENAKDKGEKSPHRVAEKKANDWGIFDMHGNVWEWCQDRGEDAGGKETRFLRGGSWYEDPDQCRSSYSVRVTIPHRGWGHGFRVVADFAE